MTAAASSQVETVSDDESPASVREPESADLREYRSQLIEAEHAAQASYDRTVLALSGGALGLSITFVDKFIGDAVSSGNGLLLASWILWALSLSCILVSHYLSALSMRKALHQLDAGLIRDEHPGGWFDGATAVLNPIGGALFLTGVVTMILFAATRSR